VRCGLTPDLDRRSVEIPLWMFDAALCGAMRLAVEPALCAEALRELKILLGHGGATRPARLGILSTLT
jgi:hypothetical protein